MHSIDSTRRVSLPQRRIDARTAPARSGIGYAPSGAIGSRIARRVGQTERDALAVLLAQAGTDALR